MTTAQPQGLVNHSVNPFKSIGGAPVYGVTPEQKELMVDKEWAMEGKTEAPANGMQDENDKDEKGEKEIDDGDGEDIKKPRVGRRLLLLTKAEIADQNPLHLKTKRGAPTAGSEGRDWRHNFVSRRTAENSASR